MAQQKGREQCDANQIEFFHQEDKAAGRLLVFGNPQKNEEDADSGRKAHRENQPPEVSGQNTAKHCLMAVAAIPGKRHKAHGDTRRVHTSHPLVAEMRIADG